MFLSRNLQKRSLRTLASLFPYENAIMRRYDSAESISNDAVSLVKYVSPFVGGARWMSGKSMRSRVAERMQNESSKTLREIRRSKKLKLKLMTDEERLIYNLRRAKKKVALLLQKLKKYELPELPPPRHDPELLTPEQLQAYKKIGFRNKNYCPVGVRGVFGGIVQNMHLHWKFHETVQVCCDNFPKEKIKEMASMLARLSGGIVINIHNVKTIIMFRGRNYRQPKILIPINTLTKRKALFKARFEQALESQKLNIKKIEQELRRKGINPEDPAARASIQRVASTFFNAIDKKEGSPYIFQDNDSRLGPGSSVDQKHSAEDSDQEELDQFIAEIEKAADEEWAAEEEAEKEEVARIRYWNKEDLGSRFRRSEMNGSEESDNEMGGRTRSRSKTYGRKIDDDGDNEHIYVSEDESELDSDDDRHGRNNDTNANMYRSPDRQPKNKTEKWQKGKSNRPMSEARTSRNYAPNLKGKMATKASVSDNMFSDLEDEMSNSDDEEGQNSTQPAAPNDYRSSSDDEEDYDHKRRGESMAITGMNSLKNAVVGSRESHNSFQMSRFERSNHINLVRRNARGGSRDVSSSSDENTDSESQLHYPEFATSESDEEDEPGSRASRDVGNNFKTRGQGKMKKDEEISESKRRGKNSKDLDETWDSD